jgi:NAD-dependent SIR2 family protein deacetylase
MIDADAITAAAKLIQAADGLLVTTGAGIGVDSGLPDFRGDEGFWKAYPPLAQAGVRFAEIANPAAFHEDPWRAWGFYGHRLRLYRETAPHEGFAILQRWAATKPAESFVFTSNVDGAHQKAGVPSGRIVECHGSIHYLQCTLPCTDAVWAAERVRPQVDESTCRLTSELPMCPHCGRLARPNILLFNDSEWVSRRTDDQYRRMQAWIDIVKRPVVIEIEAGTHIPSVRHQGEALGAPLVRINPAAATVRRRSDVSVPTSALLALRAIDARLAALG